MEEVEIGEVGVDKLGDEVREQVKEFEEKREQASRWTRWLALSTAIFAVLAAIASLRSGQLANEALLQMNEATLKQAAVGDQWAYYQAKGIEQVTRLQKQIFSLLFIHLATPSHRRVMKLLTTKRNKKRSSRRPKNLSRNETNYKKSPASSWINITCLLTL